MVLEPGVYRPFTLRTFSPSHRAEIHLTVLPKLSPSQLKEAIKWAEESEFRVIPGRRVLLSIEPTPRTRFTLAAQGWMAGIEDPLLWGAECINRMFALPREPLPPSPRLNLISRYSYFSLKRTKGGFDLTLNPRIEQKGRLWGQVRKRFACALVPDELYTLGLVVSHARPSRVTCWTSSAMGDTRPVVTTSGLFFESRLTSDEFVDMIEKSIRLSPAKSKVAKLLIASPTMTIAFKGSSWKVSRDFVRKAYEGLNGWCYDPGHLTGAFVGA